MRLKCNSNEVEEKSGEENLKYTNERPMTINDILAEMNVSIDARVKRGLYRSVGKKYVRYFGRKPDKIRKKTGLINVYRTAKEIQSSIFP